MMDSNTQEKLSNNTGSSSKGKISMIAKLVFKAIGGFFISILAIVSYVFARLYKSFVLDLVCCVLGPINLYKNTKPEGWGWLFFGIKTIVLTIYNIIALLLNATLGFVYNIFEGAFMVFELLTKNEVTVIELYSTSGETKEKEEEKSELNNKDKLNDNDKNKNNTKGKNQIKPKLKNNTIKNNNHNNDDNIGLMEDKEEDKKNEEKNKDKKIKVDIDSTKNFLFGNIALENKLSCFLKEKIINNTKGLTGKLYSILGEFAGAKDESAKDENNNNQEKLRLRIRIMDENQERIPKVDAVFSPIKTFRR